MDDAAPKHEQRLIIGALLTSFFSDFLKFSLAIWIYTEMQSVLAFSIIAMVAFLPGFLVSPTIGLWLDRTCKVRALRHVALALAAVALAGIAGAQLGLPAFALAIMVTAVISIADAIEFPAYSAAGAQLVAPLRLQGFNGSTEAARATSMLAAPLAAGLLITVLPSATLFAGAAVIALFAWAVLRGLPAAMAAPDEAAASRGITAGESFRELKATLGTISDNPPMVRLLAVFVILNALMAIFLVLFYPMILQQFSEQEAAAVRFGLALGLVIGGLLARTRLMRGGGVAMVAIGAAAVALLMIGVASGPPLMVAMVLQVGIGCLMTAIQAKSQCIWQDITPLARMGRVFAARRMIASMTIPLMYTAAPLMVEGSSRLLSALPWTIAVINGHGAAERLSIGLTAAVCLVPLLWLARYDARLPAVSQSRE